VQAAWPLTLRCRAARQRTFSPSWVCFPALCTLKARALLACQPFSKPNPGAHTLLIQPSQILDLGRLKQFVFPVLGLAWQGYSRLGRFITASASARKTRPRWPLVLL